MNNTSRSFPMDSPQPVPTLRHAMPLILASIFIAAWPGHSALAESEAARELAMDVHERPDGQDASTRGAMILQEPGRSPRERDTYDYRLDLDDGTVLSMMRFTSPADVAETGLLMHEHPDGATDQWLYLPALDRVRRIASGRRGGRFVGSDLFFEDLEDRHPDRDYHRLLGEEEFNEVATTVMESVPRSDDESVYSKRVSWIHEETMIPIRIDFFQGGDEPVKRMEVRRLERIDGYWTMMETVMEDLDSGHKTILRVEDVVYDEGLPESLFTTRALQDPATERQHRP